MRAGYILKEHCVYKISFPDGSYYIGVTCNLKQRIKQHITGPRSPYTPNVSHNIQKKFPDSFSVHVLGLFTDRIRAFRAEKNILLRHVNDDNNLNRLVNQKLHL